MGTAINLADFSVHQEPVGNIIEHLQRMIVYVETMFCDYLVYVEVPRNQGLAEHRHPCTVQRIVNAHRGVYCTQHKPFPGSVAAPIEGCVPRLPYVVEGKYIRLVFDKKVVRYIDSFPSYPAHPQCEIVSPCALEEGETIVIETKAVNSRISDIQTPFPFLLRFRLSTPNLRSDWGIPYPGFAFISPCHRLINPSPGLSLPVWN